MAQEVPGGRRVTPFGRLVRKLRIDKGVSMREMASDLGVSSAFLSGVETGKKNLSEGLRESIVRYFSGMGVGEREWAEAIAASSRAVSIDLDPLESAHREVAVAFARRLRDLPIDRIERISSFLHDDD